MRAVIVTAVVLLLLLCAGIGTAVAEEPVEISNATELQDVRDDLGADYVLVDDIDLSGIENFEPIGNVTGVPDFRLNRNGEQDAFTGTFDGDGHTISNLTIDRPNDDGVGLFGVVDGSTLNEKVVIENVTLQNVDVSGGSRVGSLVGFNDEGEVRGSSTVGDVTGDEIVGGLVGGLTGTGAEVRDSHAEVDVTSDGSAGGFVADGGDGDVHNSSATGDVMGDTRVGGLAGYGSDIHDSNATGDVTGDSRVGGLVGAKPYYNEIRGSKATGNVKGEGEGTDIGGLVGDNRGNVTDSHATGDVEGTRRVGGLIGFGRVGSAPVEGSVEDSHSTGDVTGVWLVGGLVGWNRIDVSDSYATGDVNGYVEVGGLVGENNGDVERARAEGRVGAESRVGGLVGELGSGSVFADSRGEGSLVDSRWETEEAESIPAVGVRKTGTTFENVTPDIVGESGEVAGRAPASESGSEIWKFDDAGVGFESSPTVVDGTVYIGNDDGNVYAVDAEDGTKEWEYPTTDPVSSSPSVAGGVVYVGSDGGDVYALDASGGSFISGPVVWRSDTGSSPTVAGGNVYVESDELYALDASDGTVEWRSEVGGEASPVVVDETVYTSTDEGVYALDASDGEVVWKFETEMTSLPFPSPTVANGTVYIGDHGGTSEREGNFYAIDASDGTEEWSIETAGSVGATATVADGTVYVGDDVGDVYALDAQTGEEKWKYESRGWYVPSLSLSSPTVADGTVYMGSDKYLHALDAETGEELWRFEVEEQDPYVGPTSPTVVDGTVYVGSSGGNLYAINAGVSGSSEGSRVLLGTLGHHHTWAEEQSEYINVESGLPLPAVVGVVVLIAALAGGALLRRRSGKG